MVGGGANMGFARAMMKAWTPATSGAGGSDSPPDRPRGGLRESFTMHEINIFGLFKSGSSHEPDLSEQLLCTLFPGNKMFLGVKKI